MQEIETTLVRGSGTEAGQIITTTVAGRNGQEKQVICFLCLNGTALPMLRL